MEKIILISCVKSKNKGTWKARDLYISPLFKKSLLYAEGLKDISQIFILSAKYGLIGLNDVISDYEKTLISMGTHETFEWGRKVIDQLHSRQLSLQTDRYIFLAGKTYIDPLRAYIHIIEEPMHGLGLGSRLSWLNQQIGESTCQSKKKL